jgi:hypothetical protein
MDDNHVEKVRGVNRENRRLTVLEVYEEVCITASSCHTILTEKLEMHRVAAKFVRLLTDDQKANRVTINQELFVCSNAEENCLENIITGDETWVYGYDIETKAQSSQWVGKLSPRQKKARQRIECEVFFWGGGASFIMSLFHVARQSMDSFTWRP